jgi:hypothetical protein
MKTVARLVLLALVFSGGLLAAAKTPEGEMVKVYIQNKTFKGELLSVTPELIVIMIKEKDKERKIVKETVLGCPTLETEIVKVQKRCGPVGAIFMKAKKFTFKKSTPAKINENLVKLSYYALYGSLIPDHIRERMKIFGRG